MADVRTKSRYYLPTVELFSQGKFGSVVPAFSNQYDVWINFGTTTVSGNSGQSLLEYIKSVGFFSNGDHPGDYLSLFCSEAALPGSRLKVSNVSGIRQGINQQFAMNREYGNLELTYYSQQDYYTTDVFNAWMEFISPTSFTGLEGDTTVQERMRFDNGSYKRGRYPDEYKCNIEVSAFSKESVLPEMRNERVTGFVTVPPPSITYHLKKAFPVNIVASPLSYGEAELIKTTINFAYEQYYIERFTKVDENVVQKDLRTNSNPQFTA